MNDAKMMGRLTRDPEVRRTAGNHVMTRFSLAVDRDYKDASGNRPVDFWDIQAWDKLGELVAQFVNKGCRVFVKGRYEENRYTAEDGTPRVSHTIIADKIRFLDFKPSDSDTAAPPAAYPTAQSNTLLDALLEEDVALPDALPF